jgi:hypothetical protein
MMTRDKPQIRNVLATAAGHTGGKWVCHPLELGIDDRICGVCRKQRLKPYVATCSNCHAEIFWDVG